MSLVGLVVNPHAGRDVRRITSLARAVGVQDRANIAARVLAGLTAAGVEQVLYMPDTARTVTRAAVALRAATGETGPDASPVHVPGDVAADSGGTSAAAAAMWQRGVTCIVAVGGDGTHRAVFKGCPDAVLVPVAGGTNNAVATTVEPASAGLAAGRFVHAPQQLGTAVRRHAALETHLPDGRRDVALADVAWTRQEWTGAHALWDAGALRELVLARSDPTVPGLVGLAGMITPLGDDQALHVQLGAGGRRVLAPVGPGRFASVAVRSAEVISFADEVTFRETHARSAVAFDGEREAVLRADEPMTVRLTRDGPRVLDVAAVLRATAPGPFRDDHEEPEGPSPLATA